MKNFFLELIPWWSSQTLGTRIYTLLNGKFVGTDADGNKYYLNKKNDIEEIESIYINGTPQLVVIDNFLNPEALSNLQKFCRSSNIFKYPYVNGYIGAFLTKGFANKFILELGEDMRKTYPKIFEDTLLSQAWAFKYDSVGKGIDVHADQATVNVNFWIAPEAVSYTHLTLPTILLV